MALLNTYKIGDTLSFKSIKSGSVRKYKILDIENSSNGFSEAHFGAQQYGRIKYARINFNGVEEWEVLKMFKDKMETKIILTFGAFYSEHNGGFDNLNTSDSIVIRGKSFKDYYEIAKHDLSTAYEDSDLVKIYWKQNLGIIKFDLKNGDSFIRVNP